MQQCTDTPKKPPIKHTLISGDTYLYKGKDAYMVVQPTYGQHSLVKLTNGFVFAHEHGLGMKNLDASFTKINLCFKES